MTMPAPAGIAPMIEATIGIATGIIIAATMVIAMIEATAGAVRNSIGAGEALARLGKIRMSEKARMA